MPMKGQDNTKCLNESNRAGPTVVEPALVATPAFGQKIYSSNGTF